MAVEELVPLIQKLWPDPAATPGKITLITRFGAGKVEKMLPPLIKAVQASGLQVVWTCDPMHGNTTKSEVGSCAPLHGTAHRLRCTFVRAAATRPSSHSVSLSVPPPFAYLPPSPLLFLPCPGGRPKDA